MFVLNQASSCEDEDTFLLIGTLCGMALFNRCTVPFPFPRALYKKLLDLAPTLEDLEELLPTVGRYEPGMARASAGSLALTMHREIPEAEFGAPVASTFAIVKLLEATDFQGGPCPEHGCCSQRLVLPKQKAKPHGLEGVRSLLHKSLSPHCEYIVQNTLGYSLDLKELRTQLLMLGFFL